MTLNEIFKRLLGLFSNKAVCHKLERSASYQAGYNKWLGSNAFTEVLKDYFKAYHFKKAGMQCQYRVQLIQEQHRHGVILFFNPQLPPKSFSFLFDYLKNQVLQQGYQLHSAHRRKLTHERYLQHTETYLLTPIPADVPGTKICNQLYGNILIEYTLVNRHPGYIRFVAESFTDTHFSNPMPFEELLASILNQTENQ